MTSYVTIEFDGQFGFDIQEVTDMVCDEVLRAEECPYEASVNLLITDNNEIQQMNATYREINRATDVLSFPNLHFESPGDFSEADKNQMDCFDPDSGELMLGDIIISAEKVREQADEYNHSVKREFAFLVAHSMFHLCGYDHMTDAEASVMEEKQQAVLETIHITREEG